MNLTRLMMAGVSLAMLAGCATPPPPLYKNTQSGYAEGVFSNVPLENARSSLINGCASKGLVVEDTSGSQVICSKGLQGMQAVGVQMAIGNSYSTTPVAKIRFVLMQLGGDTKVIAYPWAETIMPLGQARTMETNGNADRNSIQEFLRSVGAY